LVFSSPDRPLSRSSDLPITRSPDLMGSPFIRLL
jgi:hypothetical protein